MGKAGLVVLSIGWLWCCSAAAGERCSNREREAAEPSRIELGELDVNRRPRIVAYMHTLRDILAAYERFDSANRYVIEDGEGEWIARLCMAFSFFADDDQNVLSEARSYGVRVREKSDGVIVLSPEPGRMKGPLLPPREL